MYVTPFPIFKFCSTLMICLQNIHIFFKQFGTCLKIVTIWCFYHYYELSFSIKISQSFKHLAEIIYNHIFQSEYDKGIVLISVKMCGKCFLKESQPLCYVKQITM